MIYDLLVNYKFDTDIIYELIVENENKKVFLLKINETYYIANLYSNLLLAEKDLLIFKKSHYLKNDYVPPIIENKYGEKITVINRYYGVISLFIKNELNYGKKENNTELILTEYLEFIKRLNIDYSKIDKKYLENYSIEHIINQCLLKFKNYKDYTSIEIVLKSIKEKLDNSLQNTILKQEIIHGDLHQGNIILNNNKLYIIDFEDIGIGSIFFDVASLMLEKDIVDSNIVKKLLKEYYKYDEIDIELNLKVNIILVNLIVICRNDYKSSITNLLMDLKKIKAMC